MAAKIITTKQTVPILKLDVILLFKRAIYQFKFQASQMFLHIEFYYARDQLKRLPTLMMLAK